VLEDLKEALRADERLAWQDGANCKGANADLFFPERGASTLWDLGWVERTGAAAYPAGTPDSSSPQGLVGRSPGADPMAAVQ